MPTRSNASPPAQVGVRDRFNRISARLTEVLGSFEALVASVLLVVIWGLTGPIFNFSDTWQLFINTSTTVITFWMVFVIQNSANRDAKAIHLKLDELLRVHNAARNELITLEQQPEAVIARTAEELAAVAQEAGGSGEAVITVAEPAAGRTKRATVTATAKAKAKPDVSTSSVVRSSGTRTPRPKGPETRKGRTVRRSSS